MAELERVEIAGRQHLRLTTDRLSVELVPALGGSITSLVARVPAGAESSPSSGDTELLWRPPWGLRPGGAAPLPGSASNVAIDSWSAGWLTMFPNGSEAGTVDGADWPAWGEARLAWCDWRVEGDAVVLTSRLSRSPFELTKTISVVDDTVTLDESVRNFGEEHVDVVWGSSLTFGEPLVGAHTRFDSGAALVRPDARQTPSADYDDILPWPRSYTADGLVNLRGVPDPSHQGVSRTAYLSDFGSFQARVSNPQLGLGVELQWEGETWPYLWYQLETGGRFGYPWWGAARFLSLTASTSWPSAAISEIRRISATSVRVQPGSSRTAHLQLRVGSG